MVVGLIGIPLIGHPLVVSGCGAPLENVKQPLSRGCFRFLGP